MTEKELGDLELVATFKTLSHEKSNLSSAEVRFLINEIRRLNAELEKLAKFKAYVHQRLDDAGIPVDPESAHKAEGCRIGGRLDIVLGRQKPIEVHLNTRGCKPMDEKTASVLGEVFAKVHAAETAKQIDARDAKTAVAECERLRAELANVSALLQACEANIELARLSALEDAAKRLENIADGPHGNLRGYYKTAAAEVRQMKGSVK